VFPRGATAALRGTYAYVLHAWSAASVSREGVVVVMNADSSRSHSIFQLSITQRNTSNQDTRTSVLRMVDLAGSEKVHGNG
jgi:kinesin family member 5